MINISFDQMVVNPENVLTLARITTIKALTKAGQDWRITPEFDDMQAQAAWKIYNAMQVYPGKHILYYYAVGSNAAMSWRQTWRLGVKGVRDPQKSSVDFADVFHKGSDFEEMDEDRFSELAYVQHYFDTDTLYDTLVSWFLQDRDKKGERGLTAARRDADICLWAAQGLTNLEISEVTGIKVSTVKEYRKRIRALLQMRLEGEPKQPVAAPVTILPQEEPAEENQMELFFGAALQRLRDANLFADDEEDD
jgi:hypothetical protein